MKYINVAYEFTLVTNTKEIKEGNVHTGTPLFYNNQEFSKVHNVGTYKFKEEIQKDYNLKFPITAKKFEDLDTNIRLLITKGARYGINTENIKYRYYNYKDCINLGLKFILPLRVDNQHIVDVDIDKLSIPSDLATQLQAGNAKIIIYQDSEGFFFNTKHIEWFNKLASHFNLNKNNFIVESANFKWPESTKGYYLTNSKFINSEIIKFEPKVNSNFFERGWFTKVPLHRTLDKGYHYSVFNQYLYDKLNNRHTKKFLCLQRRLSEVRAVVFYNLHTNKKLSKHSLYSLLNPYKSNISQIKSGINRLKLRDSKEISQWFENNFDIENGISLDRTDQEVNWATELNRNLHNDTFLNLVIETHQFPSSELFFSEKSVRPIYTAQPFIIFGNPESLKYLKQLGYKTFSDFWDESYDEDVPLQERFDRLFNTLESIADKPMEELNEWLCDMQPILEHNFNTLMRVESLHKRNKELSKWIEL